MGADVPPNLNKPVEKWWIERSGLQGNPLLRKGLLDVRLYDGWEGNAVDPNGVKDSTKALQQAVNDERDHELVAFFPTGTYRISDTLNCMKQARWSEKLGRWTSWDNRRTTLLLGSTKGRRPVLKLVDNAEGFGDTAHLKPAVILWNQLGGTRAGKWKNVGKPRTQDEVVGRSPPPTTCDIMQLRAESDSSAGFNQQLRGKALDLRRGRWHGSQARVDRHGGEPRNPGACQSC
jgi:hypothetical protein